MTDKILINLFPVLLAVITLTGVKRAKKGEVADGFLSLEQTKLLQGAASIAIILHHLTQRVTAYGAYRKGPVTQFNYMGILFTSVFFFASGYGLIKSVYTKPDYLMTFLRKRLTSVLVPFFIINLLGVLLFKYYCNYPMDAALVRRYILGTYLINSNAWFIIEIVALYLCFYVLFRLIRNKDAALVLLCIATVVLIAFASRQGHDTDGYSRWFKGEWWYNSTIVFVAGMLFARFQERLTVFFNRRYAVKLVTVVILFAAAYVLSVYTVNSLGYYHLDMSFHARRDELITLVSQSAVCLLSTLLVLLLSMKLSLDNRALRYLGSISLELYLVHEFLLDEVFGGRKLSDPVYFAAVIGTSLVVAAVLSPIIKWIVAKLTSLMCKKKADGAEHRVKKAGRHINEYELAQRKIKRRRTVSRILLAAFALFAVSALVYMTFLRNILAKSVYDSEMKALKSAAVGDRVFYGRYDTDNSTLGRDRLSWIVIKKDGNRLCLVTEYGISGSSYNQKHERVRWEDSDLRAMLNSDSYLSMFSKYELDSIVTTDGDTITLLTAEQAREAFAEDQDRELAITEVAENQGTNININSKVRQWDMKGYRSSWWWLRGEPGVADIYAPVVSVDGQVLLTDKEVNRPNGAVRPCIEVLLEP